MSSPPNPPIAQTADPDFMDAVGAHRQAQWSLALGIASCIPAVGVLCCLPAIVYGHLALSHARRASRPVDLRVVVGLTLGYVIAVIYLWMIVGLFVVPALSGQ